MINIKNANPETPQYGSGFNAYRFADYKDEVIDLLQRVCTVSVATMDVVDDMAYWKDGKLVVLGDRDKHEWAALALGQWFNEPEDPRLEGAWSET